MKIAVCIHLYHIDMLPEIQSYLSNLQVKYDLFFSLVRKYPISFLNNLKRMSDNVTITIVENKGMDIGGFLNSYKLIDESYDLILKIHTKKSLGSDKSPSLHRQRHGVDSALSSGKIWFNDLMQGVLGSKEKVNLILKEFENNKNCGMIGNRITNKFHKNLSQMNEVFKILNTDNNFPTSMFIGGTIFWVRNSIFKKYLTNENIDIILSKSPLEYVPEPSINHAMERIFGCLVYKENYNIISLT